ncbi:hypothetical protein GYMLUDRAFT_952997 [Collybiopsis luxurians FD-317 M1]|nr:hypothetical protein GYMLUDRAFT_952997 [Collybiopsis luxurians FD-317 M1]
MTLVDCLRLRLRLRAQFRKKSLGIGRWDCRTLVMKRVVSRMGVQGYGEVVRLFLEGQGFPERRLVLLQILSSFANSVQDSPVLPFIQQPAVISQLAQRRKDLKPMGHKRRGSPFPLTLSLNLVPSRPAPSPPTPTSDVISYLSSDPPSFSAPAATPTFRAPSPPLSLLSSTSDSSDALLNVLKRRKMIKSEPAGMPVLGEKGLPLPSVMVTVATPTIGHGQAQAQAQALVASDSAVADEDMSETPVQSPTTPTAGQFALAQTERPSLISRSQSLLTPGTHHRRDRPRQRVPESVVVFGSPSMSLDPFAESDAESLTSAEDYWSARSSLGSFSSSREKVWY